MSSKPYYYWDACVFLSWLEAVPDRIASINDVLSEIAATQGRIITSSLSIVEVAFLAQEDTAAGLDASYEENLNNIWTDSHVVIIEPHIEIMYEARRLMRTARSDGLSLKPNDAVQLATALWYEKSSKKRLVAIHTYDKKWFHERYQTLLGIHIEEPHIRQMKLPL